MTYIPVVIMAVLAIFLFALIKNDRPVHSNVIHKNGYVVRRRLRRPKVSIVKNAGNAKTQFKMPVPMEASKAEVRP